MEYNILNNPVLKWWQRHQAWQNRILVLALPLLVTLCWLLSIKLMLPLQLILGFLLAVFCCRLILLKPQVGLFVLLFFDFFVYVLSDKYVGLLPQKVVWLSDGIFFLFFLHVIFAAVRTGRWRRTVIDLPLLFFLAAIILSALANHSGLLATMLGLRFYLKFPLFYVLLVNLQFEPRVFQTYQKWFLGLIFLQIPFTIFEFFVLKWRIDDVGGTLGPGGTSQMGLMCVLAQCVFLTYLFEGSKHRVRYFLYTVLLLIPAVLGSINASFLFLTLLLGFILVRKLFSRGALRMLVIIPGLVLALWGSLKIYSEIMPENTAVMMLQNPRAVWEVMFSGRLHKGRSINRLVQIPSAFQQAWSSKGKFWFGEGPYEYAEFSKVTASEDEFESEKFLSGIGYVQITRTLLELGMLGMVASIWLMGAVWWLAWRYCRTAATEDQFLRGRTVELMWVFFAVLATAYGPVWQVEHVAIPFWVWVASLSAVPTPQP